MSNRKRTTMGPFRCYYCGELRSSSERSEEHIIPTCIGGTRNVTATFNVCRSCNQLVGDQVDTPFGRDWFIQGMRLISGTSNRGKPLLQFRGMLKWLRPEPVRVFLLQGGAHILDVLCADGSRAIAVLVDDKGEAALQACRNVVRKMFKDVRILNGALPRRAYDEELLSALPRNQGIRASFDVTAWDRAIVKMGLGLACLTLGDAFVQSAAAAKLRAFLREPDSVRRDEIDLRGQAGILSARPGGTWPIHPGGYQHLFLLVDPGYGLGFSANLFGQFENSLLLADNENFGELLPGHDYFDRGLGWVVDPNKKTTRGPIPLLRLIAEAVDARREMSSATA